jgi:ABC-2 type transport system permease protein
MSWEILKFELRYHLRQPLFYILFVIFFFMTFGAVTSDAVTLGGALGNVNRNAPFVIMQLLLVMSVFGVLTTTAYVASAINRDFEFNTDSLFFSAPIQKSQYLFGRFSAAFIVSSLVYLGVVTAIMIGSFMPWLDKEQLGPFVLKPYVFSFFVLILPNLLLFAAIFFAVAALTRSLMATYTSVAAFYVAYIVSRFTARPGERKGRHPARSLRLCAVRAHHALLDGVREEQQPPAARRRLPLESRPLDRRRAGPARIDVRVFQDGSRKRLGEEKEEEVRRER